MRALLLSLAVLLVPAGASAAPLGQVPPLDLRGDEYCVRATGTPGELAVETPTGIRIVQATREGMTTGREIRLGEQFSCGTVEGKPLGAGVIVGTSLDAVVAVVREPGGDWGAAQVVIPDDPETSALQVIASVSERGDVIVGVKERVGNTYRFRVVRGPAGGSFGAPEQLGRTIANTGQLQVDISAAGEAVALYSTIEGRKPPFKQVLNVAIAPPGQPFGAPAHLADSQWLSMASLDVAADGRALVAVPDTTSVLAFEREPGAAGFGAATVVGKTGDGLTITSGRLGVGGAAAVGWVQPLDDEVQFAQRPAAGGAFTPARPVLRVPVVSFDPFYFSQTFLSQLFGEPSDLGGVYTRGEPTGFLLLSPDGGRALLAAATGPLSTSTDGIGLAEVNAAGLAVHTAGAGLDRPSQALPFVLGDGTAAVAWTTSLDEGRYRLHVASQAVTERPDPPAPKVKVGRQDREVVSEQRALHVPITCSGPCEVRAHIDLGGVVVPYLLRMSKAGTRTMDLDGLEMLATRRLTRIPVALTYGAPGALHPRTRNLTLRVRRAGPDDPSVTHLKAVRRGEQVVVTFNISGNPKDWGAFVSGDDTRGWSGEPAVTRIAKGRKDKREYRLTLPGKGVNYVTLRTPRFITLPGPTTVAKVR